MGKDQLHNRQHSGALENRLIGHFFSIMWKSLPPTQKKSIHVHVFNKLLVPSHTVYILIEFNAAPEH